MSRLVDGRTAILEALAAAGVVTATGGQLAPPCVLVEPGDPWSEPLRLPGRAGRWRLTAIAAAVDTLGGFDELADLVDLVDVGLRGLAGAQLPTWGRPVAVEIADGVRRTATIATIQYASS